MMLPAKATGTVLPVQGFDALYDALLKAAATARTMPDRVAEKFGQMTANLPRSTEAERLVVQRVGQDPFRGALAHCNVIHLHAMHGGDAVHAGSARATP